MIKFGILGAGFMFDAHLGGLTANGSDNVKYVAVCDIDKEKCDEKAQKYGLKAYYDFDEMLADPDVDVVDICLPSHLHEKFAIIAAKAKKNILLEKPVAMSVESAQNIFDAAKENGIRIMVAQTLRFWAEYAKITEMVKSGELGDIVSIAATRLGQAPTWAEWYQDPEMSGELLLNLTIHDIDYVHHLLGKPKSVYSAGSKDAQGGFNDVVNIIRFKNGTNVVIDGSMSMTPGYPFTMYMRVLGTKGTVEFSFKAGVNIDAGAVSSLTVFLEGEGGGKPVEHETYDAYGKEIQYFADCIEQGTDPEMVTEESVLTVTKTLMKAKESLITGDVYDL